MGGSGGGGLGLGGGTPRYDSCTSGACQHLCWVQALSFVPGVAVLFAVFVSSALAQDLVLTKEITDPLPPGSFVFLPFEVPAGVAELAFSHVDTSGETGDRSITDVGLLGPDGALRGWSGGNNETVVIAEHNATRGYLPGVVDAGEWTVLVGLPGAQAVPYVFTAELIFRAESTLPADPDRGPWVDAGVLRAGEAWVAGDVHVHSEHSGDARPSLDEVAEAAEAAGLDFVVLSEHNTTSHLTQLSAVQARHPDVLLIPGVEWTSHRGHALGLGAVEAVPFWVGADGLGVVEAAEKLHDQGALVAPAHPGLALGDLCLGCAWEHELPSVWLHAIEVQTLDIDRIGTFLYDAAVGMWDDVSDEGVHIAALGGSDSHNGAEAEGITQSPVGVPITMVQVDDLSVSAVLEGIRSGRTTVRLAGLASPMVALDAPGRVGDSVSAQSVAVEFVVEGGAGHTLRVIEDGVEVDVLDVDTDPWTGRWTVTAPATGERRVRGELQLEGQPRTVTSHVWVRRPAEDTAAGDGGETAKDRDCGCVAVSGGAMGAWVGLSVWALFRRQDPVPVGRGGST